ncbi:MAG: hypothetical protein ACYSUB_20765 [Planctomycetota bacterium]
MTTAIHNPDNIKPCPCGETPPRLVIQGRDRDKWMYVYGDCCGEWNVEFRSDYNVVDSDECMERAISAWNDAKRPEDE